MTDRGRTTTVVLSVADHDRLRGVRTEAHLQVPKTRPKADALIAATALTHNLVLVTRNVSDFSSTGVSWINPWTGDSSLTLPWHGSVGAGVLVVAAASLMPLVLRSTKKLT